MSLILDALRRADAQRERDPGRGIHAQPAAPPEDDGDSRWIDRLPLARRLLPWVGGLVLLLAVLVGWREVRQVPDGWNPSHSLPALPAGTGSRVAQPPPAPAAHAPASAILPAPAPGRRASPPSAPASLPSLTISGSVYAADPRQRLLIVNGKVHGEGEEPVPGVRVEGIRSNAAVLRFRGQRYEVGF